MGVIQAVMFQGLAVKHSIFRLQKCISLIIPPIHLVRIFLLDSGLMLMGKAEEYFWGRMTVVAGSRSGLLITATLLLVPLKFISMDHHTLFCLAIPFPCHNGGNN